MWGGENRDDPASARNKARSFAFFLCIGARVPPSPHIYAMQPPQVTAVELAEAIVEGDALLVSQQSGQAPPAWAYINLLAHNNRARLVQVRGQNASRRPFSAWGAILYELIGDILEHFHTEDELLDAQRQALVPLELAVWDGRPLEGPQDLDAMVRGALHLRMWRPS